MSSNSEAKVATSRPVRVRGVGPSSPQPIRPLSVSADGIGTEAERVEAPAALPVREEAAETCNEARAQEPSAEPVTTQEEPVTTEEGTVVRTSPRALFDYLAARVIGQDAAKKQLAVSVFHHQFGKRGADASRLLRKQNLLFLGPTGSGKTWLLQSLARGLDIPMVTVSATAFTQAGYVGDDVDSMLRYLLQRCDNDVERAENGIIFIDEIDKIAGSGQSELQVRDVSGTGVQQDLLTMMEGTTVRLPAKGGPRHLAHDFIEIDTHNIMFVAAGAFVGLEMIVEARLDAPPEDEKATATESKRRVSDLRRQALVEDLIDFGLLPEFAGRFSAYVSFDHLLTDDLVAILNNPLGSPVHEYRRYFEAYAVALEVEEDALRAIAEAAEELGTGARALRAIVDRCFQDALFELPQWQDVARVVFTRQAVLGEERPLLFCAAGKEIDRWSD